MAWSIALCSELHSSNSTERTLEMLTPRFRWIPEHSMQTRIPRFSDAHVGLGMPQSAQNLLPGLSKLGCEPLELNERVESTDRTSVPTRLKTNQSSEEIFTSLPLPEHLLDCFDPGISILD